MLIRFLPFYSDDDGTPHGGDAKPRPSDVLEQYGRDALRLAEKLADVQSDNYRLRDERRKLKQELADVVGKVPAGDAKVLTKDEADAYEAYLSFGPLDSLKLAIAGAEMASSELRTLKRERAITKAAEAVGYKASVLTTLAGDLDIQMEASKDGTQVVYVVKDGEKTALTDYAAKQWADFLPALTPKVQPQAPDINAGARGNGNGTTITDEERTAAKRRYSATF